MWRLGVPACVIFLFFLCLGCTRAPVSLETPPGDAAGMTTEGQDSTYLGKPVQYWIKQAGAEGPDDAAITAKALGLALDDESPSVRVAAADALGMMGAEAAPAATALASKLGDDSAWVRVAAMETLGQLGTPAVAPLIDSLQNGSRPVRRRSALVLGSIGPDAKQAIPLLEKALRDESSDVHDLAAKVLGSIAPSAEGSVPETPTVEPATDPTLDVNVDLGDRPRDWPGFHGPNRDSLSPETGLLQQWPVEGPKLLWQLPGLGRGYSTISITGGRMFTMGDQTPQGEDESQFVLAFDLESRTELWATRVGPPHDDGPRCTPTVDGELLYVLGTDGDLVCAAADTGEIRWQRNLVTDFDGRIMSIWKFSESPLIDGGKLICTPGGEEAAIVALDKLTGELIWKAAVPEIGTRGKDGAGYSSAVVAEIEGVRQYVQVIGRGVVGVATEDGRFLWGYNGIANTIANITSPVVRGNHVFATTAYGTGSALLRITREGDFFQAEEVYFLDPKQFENHHGGVVLLGDYIYGGTGTNKGRPVCLEFATGKIAWNPKAPARGSAAVVYADGHLVLRYDRGLVTLIEATPHEFRVKGSFEAIMPEGPAWAHPVIHGGKLYLRHNDLLFCYDVRADGS